MANAWNEIATAPVNEEVWTKIDDEHGERNVAKLTRKGWLWFTEPEGGMYVYYLPTHWCRSSIEPPELTEGK